VLEKLASDPKTMPMKPMSVEQWYLRPWRSAQNRSKNRSRPAEPHLERPRARFPCAEDEANLLGKGLAKQVRICRTSIIPGRVNRIMNALIPAAMARRT